jgi:hypothetical protein
MITLILVMMSVLVLIIGIKSYFKNNTKKTELTELDKYLLIKDAEKQKWKSIDYSKTKFVVCDNKIVECYVSKFIQLVTLACAVDEGVLRYIHKQDIFDTKEDAEKRLQIKPSEPIGELIDWRGGYKLIYKDGNEKVYI